MRKGGEGTPAAGCAVPQRGMLVWNGSDNRTLLSALIGHDLVAQGGQKRSIVRSNPHSAILLWGTAHPAAGWERRFFALVCMALFLFAVGIAGGWVWTGRGLGSMMSGIEKRNDL